MLLASTAGARDPVKCPIAHRMAPPSHLTKNDLVPQVNSAKAEKPSSRSRVVNSGPPECYSMCKVNFHHT